MLVFLIGYMGSGKTVLGRHLAEMLHYRFLDMDEMIEISTGYTIANYFRKFGEARFREKERDLLINHLGEKDCVIATGGGTPCYADNMDLMNAAGISVYIEAGTETILQRLEGKIRERPLLDNVPAGQLPRFISDHLESRKAFYDKASLRISGEDPDLEGLAKEIQTLAGPINSSF